MSILESGVTEKLKRKYWKENNKCTRRTAVAATIENTIGAFVVLLVGITLSMASFMAEFIFQFILRKRRELEIFQSRAKTQTNDDTMAPSSIDCKGLS